MSYEPTTWKTGDVVTAEKLNKMESGISDAGGGSGGGMLNVGSTYDPDTGNTTLDKTWQEIYDALLSGMRILFEGKLEGESEGEERYTTENYPVNIGYIPNPQFGNKPYFVNFTVGKFESDSEDGVLEGQI